MNFYDIVLSAVHEYAPYFILALSLFSLFLFILTIVLYGKLGRLARHRLHVPQMSAETSIARDSGEAAQQIETIHEEMALLKEHLNVLDDWAADSLRNIGLTRFDAFPDIGGEQSFALAILNSRKNGVIISNLFSRADSRVYVKSIEDGKSERTLSDEEQEAIRRAGIR